MTLARIVCVIALVVSTNAFAEKAYNSETSATHDCDKEPKVSINVSGGNFTLTGTCLKVGINGSKTTVKIANVKKLGVNGARNTVQVETAAEIGINGSGNTVTYKTGPGGKGRPKVGIAGTNNKVAKQTP